MKGGTGQRKSTKGRVNRSGNNGEKRGDVPAMTLHLGRMQMWECGLGRNRGLSLADAAYHKEMCRAKVRE